MAERPSRKGPGPRLAVIEGWAGRRSAIPFALLVLGVLALGLIALLSLNTAMGENSIRTQKAEQRQAQLTDREQQLSQQLSGLSAPGALASAAAAQGLVPNPQPAFLNPTTGAVLGTASPAPSPSPTPTPTPTATATASSTATPAAGATPTGSGTPTAAASGTPSTSPKPTQTASGSTR